MNPFEERAAEWLARREEGFSPREAAEFAAWRRSDPRHEAAAARLERTWQALRGLRALASPGDLPDPDVIGPARPARAYRLIVGLSLVPLGVAAALIAVLHFRSPRTAEPGLLLSTADAVQLFRLPDGTLAELNARSALRCEPAAGERRVQLVQGEARFSVAADPVHPLLVLAGPLAIRDIATVFDVRTDASGTAVLVSEGRVRVTPGPADAVTAGECARTTTAEAAVVARVTDEEAKAWTAWRDRPLQFASTPLAAAAAAFNRRNVVQLELADPSLAQLPISGSFRPDNVEGFARLLAQGGGVVVERPTPVRLVLRRPAGG